MSESVAVEVTNGGSSEATESMGKHPDSGLSTTTTAAKTSSNTAKVDSNGMESLLEALEQETDGAKLSNSSKARLEEIQRTRDARRFDNAAGSMFSALLSVESRPSALEEACKRSSDNKVPLIHQYLFEKHKHEKTGNILPGMQCNIRENDFAANSKGAVKISRKARKRKEKQKLRGVAYAQRSADLTSGVSRRRNRRGNKNSMI